MSQMSRRAFARLITSATAATVVAPLGLLHARQALAGGQVATAPGCAPASFAAPGFGPLAPRVPENHASLTGLAGPEGKLRDLSGRPLLALPEGFRYTAISITGDEMSDGQRVPGDHDGMACFAGPGDQLTLVRNHELSILEAHNGNLAGCLAPSEKRFDAFAHEGKGLGGGGTTTVIVDRQGNKVRDFVSLGGTIRNCAGGPTPWQSWISCEEDITTPAMDRNATQRHGYNFEVPAALDGPVEPIPLIAMGRMNHEAVSVDPLSGNVYETEDRHDSAFYRFVPNKKPEKFGDLQHGGTLYAMVIDADQRAACDGRPLPTSFVNGTTVVDTRGVARGGSGSLLPFLGQPLKVSWVRLEDVDPAEDTLRAEAQARGASLFWRGEGAAFAEGHHYFVCSGAGDAGEGQVWRYDERTDTVTLLVESTTESLLDGPDNITVGPDRSLYLCEDGSEGTPGTAHYSQRVVGVDQNGGLFPFAKNVLDVSEFAGACFSPDGRMFFVNSHGVGITYAVWREDGLPIALL